MSVTPQLAPGQSTRSPTTAAMPLAGRRIALFSGNYNYIRDGANQALNRLVAHLERAGAVVRVYSPTTGTPAFEPAGTLISVPSIGFPGRGEYRVGLGLTPGVRRDLERFGPDLVHLSAPDILGTKALRHARAVLGVPVVASLHTRFERYFGYYGLGFVRRWIERHLAHFYAECDYVLVPTAPILEELSPGGIDKRIRLWGRGVDRDLFNPGRRSTAWRMARGYTNADVVPLFFGRLVLEKGTDRFAEIIAQVRARGLGVRPVIIGDGPARPRLARLLPNATFTGELRGAELATAVASCDLLINPSETEAFGNVVLESMACGLPVVAADSGSTRNVIDQGQEGLLCGGAGGPAYADAVCTLLRDEQERQRLGRNAARRACAFDWDTVLDAVVAVYLEALERGSPTVRRVSSAGM